jgi:hypothetical protein
MGRGRDRGDDVRRRLRRGQLCRRRRGARKLADLQKRFRDHTLKMFEKHGMTNIGYWVPADPPNSENTLVYIIAHKDREAAKKSWADFRADPAWQAVVKESQKDGPLTSKPPESVFLNPTDYSPIK